VGLSEEQPWLLLPGTGTGAAKTEREKIIMVTNSVFFGLNKFIIFVKNSGFQDILDIYSLHINLVSIFSVLTRTLSYVFPYWRDITPNIILDEKLWFLN
jgi:hypothetical protein